ncbi:MAG TPA: phosphoadenosine phosphosulfate reductase family protein [Acidimicrobiales bacterium]|nr:phosphoadenosine phosphosulfate reductase family protein [Acidimicrobiales bacterium]
MSALSPLRRRQELRRPAPPGGEGLSTRSLPVPLLHVDTGHNFDEVLEFRDKAMADLGEEVLVASVQDSIDRGRSRSRTRARWGRATGSRA